MRAGTETWRQWLDRNSVNTIIVNKGLTVNSYPLLIEAAVQGHCVGLGWVGLGSARRSADKRLRNTFTIGHRDLAHNPASGVLWIYGIRDLLYAQLARYAEKIKRSGPAITSLGIRLLVQWGRMVCG